MRFVAVCQPENSLAIRLRSQKFANEITTVSTREEALAQLDASASLVFLIAADFAGKGSGFTLARELRAKANVEHAKTIVIASRFESATLADMLASRCDDLVVAPLSDDELYDVVAHHAGLPRRGAVSYQVAVADRSSAGAAFSNAVVTNLSIDGMRIVASSALTERQQLAIKISLGEKTIEISAKCVWVQHDGLQTIAGVSFDHPTQAALEVLTSVTKWQIFAEDERTRVVLRGDFTEATKFDSLTTSLVGRVAFDLAEVTYMNSLGVRSWCEFLRSARITGYEFFACSVPFIVQASMVRDAIGRGTVVSFFAPYHCESCGLTQERLLQTSLVVAANLEPPQFACPACDGQVTFDDLPERYLAFLSDEE